MAEAARWTIVAPLRPRFRDTDAMGHINNAVYLTYLEETRFAHWRAEWGFGTSDPAPSPGLIGNG